MLTFNTDPAFVGIAKLKQAHNAQVTEFERWAAQHEWERFHTSHYDWWVFPISHPSRYGLKYVVYSGEVAELKQDPAFLEKYVTGVRLVAASWGWDLHRRTSIANPQSGQSWHEWPIRLYKAAQSVKLFGYYELFDSLKMYGQTLIQQGKNMQYNGKDLGEIFNQPT